MANGWNRPSGNPKPATTKKPTAMHGALAGIAVILLTAIAAFFIFSKNEKPTIKAAEKKQTAIKEVTPAPAPKAKAEEPPVDPKEEAKRKRREMLKNMTPEQRVEYKIQELQKKAIDLNPTPDQPFKTGTEQVMSWVFTTGLGDMPPPLPALPKYEMLHMAEILIADNPEVEGDTERTKEAKQIVQEAKRELREFLKEGGEVEDFFTYYHSQLIQAHEEWM